MHNGNNYNEKNYYFVFEANKLLVINNNGNIKIPMTRDVMKSGIDINNGRCFGMLNGHDCFCINKPLNYTPQGEMTFQELRQLGAIFNEKLYYLACRGLHLLRWFENNSYCNRCGSLAEDKQDETAKICPRCGYVNYPRISPAIIVAIVNEDKLLLAHNARFNNGMYSIIAGFVEPGETFEECVVREVREEVGIEVKNIKYFNSQPWPFPDSVMVGFTAQYAGGEIREDGIEILNAGWYRADELPGIPSGGSLARKLINWFTKNYPQNK